MQKQRRDDFTRERQSVVENVSMFFLMVDGVL